MENVSNNTVNQVVAADDKKFNEAWHKSIPAQVFLNYFIAFNYHIQHTEDAGLQHLAFFREHQAQLNEADVAAIGKMLLSSWSTEYALRTTAELGHEDYLRYALHWTFPQAYYAVFAGLQAFLYTLNIKTNNGDIVSRQVGRLVLRHAYPKTVNYYAAGHYPDFSLHRLLHGNDQAGLQVPDTAAAAQAQLGQFLRTTRRIKALAVRRQLQNNNQTAIRSQKTGKVLEKWNRDHWQQITWRLGYTTFFDLLSRLRISASNKEIERFVEADIDFKLFHESLLSIVSYMNGLHEAYVAKAMGLPQYQALVHELPAHLQQGFVARRLEGTLVPLFQTNCGPSAGIAA